MSEGLETLEGGAFTFCSRLRRIALPLKGDMFEDQNTINMPVFNYFDDLSHVDLVGGIHKTISFLHLESWRNEMNEEIDRINQVLPNTRAREKTAPIRSWMRSVLERIAHYKSEHYALLKEAMTLLELSLWKAKLLREIEEHSLEEEQPAKKAKINKEERGEASTMAVNTREAAKIFSDAAIRQEARVICGADVIIKNVLSFLNDDEMRSLFSIMTMSCNSN